MPAQVCPVDGQTLEWHLKVYNRKKHAKPGLPYNIYYGDFLGCGFISIQDRASEDQKYKGAQ